MNDPYVEATYQLRRAVVRAASLVDDLLWCPRVGDLLVSSPLPEQREVEKELLAAIGVLYDRMDELARLPDASPLHMVGLIRESLDRAFWHLPDVGRPPDPIDAEPGDQEIWFGWMQLERHPGWRPLRFQSELYRYLAYIGSPGGP